MAIEIKEYVGCSCNNKVMTPTTKITNVQESFKDLGPISKNSIIQVIEGIHVGPTRNFTWYTEKALRDSVPTWTTPYQRPLIMHHNEKDGKTIGRIIDVEYVTQNTRSGTPALVFTCNVPDKEGKEQIQDGRLKTVSIGIIAHDVRCSICGEQVEVIDEYGSTACGHNKGEQYGNKICYWEIHKMEAKELSYVIVPSDIYAHNLKTYKAEDFNQSIKESNFEKGVSINMTEGNHIKEGKIKTQVIDEEVKNNEPAIGEPVKEEPKTVEPKVEEPKIEDAKKADEALEAKEKEIEELKAKVEKLEAEKVELSNKVVSMTNDLNAATEKANEITAQLNKEVELKEAVETQLAEAKTQLRESKEVEFNTLRTALNKSVVLKETLSKRSNESLMDAINDLKEELSGTKNIKNISEAIKPSLDDEKNKNNVVTDVKESKTISNINVEESLKSIFSTMLNPNYY